MAIAFAATVVAIPVVISTIAGSLRCGAAPWRKRFWDT